MCGIAGFTREDKSLIRRMTNLITHRGPDDVAYFTDRNISLGMRRLSIIDLKKGIYPVHDESNSLTLIFNGEIYNHLELRKALEKNHTFASDCDAEVIVHLYEDYGEECLSHLRGMFAIALWDSKKKSLFLARDRLGIKPLYYLNDSGSLYFASEIKALKDISFNKTINRESLEHLLKYRFIPGENTILKSVKRLPPGHYMVYHNHKLRIRPYWDVNFSPVQMGERHALGKMQSILEESVKLRLMSDVPLGVYLSGGVDSGVVTSIMSKFSDSVKTFSVGFNYEKHNELGFARQVAEHLGTDHYEKTVDIDVIKALPNIVWHADEPLADPTIIPTYFISKFAKKHVTVILTGEGADEIFAGYEQYKLINIFNFLKRHPILSRSLSKSMGKLPYPVLDRLFKYSSQLGSEGKNRVKQFLSSKEEFDAYCSIVSIFSDMERLETLKSRVPDRFRALYYKGPEPVWNSGF